MNRPSIGFIGGGRIARIFLAGWTRAHEVPTHVVVADTSADTLARLKAQFPEIETTSDPATAAAVRRIADAAAALLSTSTPPHS